MAQTRIKSLYLYNSRGRLIKQIGTFKDLEAYTGIQEKNLRINMARYSLMYSEKLAIWFYVQPFDKFVTPPKFTAPRKRIVAIFEDGSRKYFKSSEQASKHFKTSANMVHYYCRNGLYIKKYKDLGILVKIEYLD